MTRQLRKNLRCDPLRAGVHAHGNLPAGLRDDYLSNVGTEENYVTKEGRRKADLQTKTCAIGASDAGAIGRTASEVVVGILCGVTI